MEPEYETADLSALTRDLALGVDPGWGRQQPGPGVKEYMEVFDHFHGPSAPPGATPTVVFSEPSPQGAIFSVRMGGNIRYQVRASSKFELLQEGGSITPPPEPPPPPVTDPLIGQIQPLRASPGDTVRAIGSFFGTASGKVFIAGIPCNISSWTDAEVAFTVPSQMSGATYTVSLERPDGKMGTAAIIVVPPSPPPPVPGTTNVRDFGAKGDGVADDYPAIQAAINKHGFTQPGYRGGVYFPAGRYRLSRNLQVVEQNGIDLFGDGPDASIVIAPNFSAFRISNGKATTDNKVRNLGIIGVPGRYVKDGANDGHGVNIDGARNTVVENLKIRGQGFGVFCIRGGGQGTRISNVDIQGWATVALFLDGGEQLRNVRCIQDDPNLYDKRSGHGFYVHSGASNIDIDGLLLENVRHYAGQIYGEDQGTVTRNVKMRNVTVKNCANGIIWAHETGAAEVREAVLEDFEIVGTYQGHGLYIKTGSDSVVRNGAIIGPNNPAVESAGLMLGIWAPYEPNQFLENLLVQNVRVEGWMKGLWIMQSNQGRFTNVRVENTSLVRNNRSNIIQETWLGQPVEGVTLIP